MSPVDDDFRETLEKLFRHEVFRPRDRLDYDGRCALTYDRLRVVGEHLPPGSALLRDLPRLFTLLEWVAIADPSVFLALTLHVCLGLGAVVEFAGDRAEDHVRELDDLSSFGALLVTEAGRGNSHLDIRTEAEYDAATGEFVVRTPDEAARKFMPNVGLPGAPKLGVVYARLRVRGRDHGVFPFVARIRTADGVPPGIRVIALPEAPLLPLDYALVEFDRLRLPRTALLSDDARLDADGVLDDPLGGPDRRLRRALEIRHNAWVASAVALAAVARAGVRNALRHAENRVTASTFTAQRAVLDHRAHQRPLFAAVADCYALTCLVDKVKAARVRSAAGRPGGEEDSAWTPGPGLNRTYGLTKAIAARLADRIVAESGRRCGAHGVFTTGRWVDYQGMAHMLGPAAGDSYLIVLEAARGMADGRHYTPPPEEDVSDVEDLFDPRLWLGLIRTRERRLHHRLTAGVRLARRRGQGAFDAWNNRSLLGNEVVGAHVARLMVEAVLDAVRDHPAAVAGAARALGAMHALAEVSEHAAWYLCEGLLRPDQVRRLADLDNELCDRVQSTIGALPQLLDVPEPLLARRVTR
ncbi:acyl-CoA oxidase [Saccharothrix tamanrassetensis]|uniref:Acyl-CoA oxidase n=1 Tax=Saccharothrix tamanrassetensis TaxID=1051531 RepID=A0A841CIQ4_9PSEU|nr:acyl-CoA dehydrogenase [Saccharothrix tamanrassetensis]MBB5957179.1 acyl-CoA oxidase [Saccharothrix tamanrassetensis]